MIWERLDNCGLYVVQAQELLANITLLEVAVLKLEEQSSALQSEVGQARTEREIAELRLSSSESSHSKLDGPNLHFSSSGFSGTFRDDHAISSPSIEPESDGLHLKAVGTPAFEETIAQQPCISLGCPTLGQELESGQEPQNSWKVCFDNPSWFSCQLSEVESLVLCLLNNTFAVWSYRSSVGTQIYKWFQLVLISLCLFLLT